MKIRFDNKNILVTGCVLDVNGGMYMG